ncbi:MAG: hypothetical protein M3133_04385 [Actinomycetota bacterium]|nr:hypothetical protein [Actinomycetota bacterium]
MTRFNIASVITLVVVVVVVAIAAILLARTVSSAQAISLKVNKIDQDARGINTATDSVRQLNRTNQLANSILDSARPLEGQLDRVVGSARSIDALAGSINATAGVINATALDIGGTAIEINDSAAAINRVAGDINRTARDINGTAGAIEATASRIRGTAAGIAGPAGGILGIARLIDRDATLINRNLDTTIRLARDIRADSGGILTQARNAHQTAACIDDKLGGQQGNDGHC